jgi:hypothetical protein
VARVRQWFEGEPGDEELTCIACSHIHKMLTIESVAVFHPGGFIAILAYYSFLLAN